MLPPTELYFGITGPSGGTNFSKIRVLNTWPLCLLEFSVCRSKEDRLRIFYALPDPADHTSGTMQIKAQAAAAGSRRKSTLRAAGIAHRIDNLGRVVIRKRIRHTVRICEDDPSQTTLERRERFCFGMMGMEKRMGWSGT